jgi:hypothetical protein
MSLNRVLGGRECRAIRAPFYEKCYSFLKRQVHIHISQHTMGGFFVFSALSCSILSNHPEIELASTGKKFEKDCVES